MDLLLMRRRSMNINLDEYITFADPLVAEMCIDAWGDGVGLKRKDALFVTNAMFRSVFSSTGTDKNITSFDELRYFGRLTQIPGSAFQDCAVLTSVVLPASVVELGSYGAFYGCASLSSINLTMVRTLYQSSFQGCSSLAIELELPFLTRIDNSCFRDAGITKIKNLGSITTIGGYSCFQGCTALTDVILPQTLTSLDRATFQGCTNLKTVICNIATPPTITGANFRDCGDAKVYVPYSSDHSILAAYQAAWSGNTYANIFDVPRLVELDENGNIPE